MRFTHLFLLAVFLWASGCVRPTAPPQLQPSLPIPPSWNAGQAVEGTVDIHWWKQFQDPQLDALIEETFSNNSQLRAVAARLETALVEARIASAERMPALGLAINSRRQRQNFIGLPLPGF